MSRAEDRRLRNTAMAQFALISHLPIQEAAQRAIHKAKLIRRRRIAAKLRRARHGRN